MSGIDRHPSPPTNSHRPPIFIWIQSSSPRHENDPNTSNAPIYFGSRADSDVELEGVFKSEDTTTRQFLVKDTNDNNEKYEDSNNHNENNENCKSDDDVGEDENEKITTIAREQQPHGQDL